MANSSDSTSEMDKIHIDRITEIARIGGVEDIKNYLDINGIHGNLKRACGTALLHTGVAMNNIQLIQLSLDYGANINDYDGNNTFLSGTPLSKAIFAMVLQSRSEDLVEFLLNHGANIEHELGGSALHFACKQKDFEIVELLLQRGANIYYTHGTSNHTTLHAAAEGGNEEIVKLFIGKFDIDVKDSFGRTPLFDAFVKPTLIRNPNAAELLLDHGASTDTREDYSDKTMLIYAAAAYYRNRGAEINLLLEFGADVNCMDRDGKNALIHATVDSSDPSGIKTQQVSDVSKENNCIGVIIRHIAKKVLQKLHVSEENLNFLKSIDKLWSYFMDCKKELEKLKVEMIENSTTNYYDILIEKDQEKLAAYAKNENVMKAMDFAACNEKFPIYTTMLRNQVKRGLWRKLLLGKVNRFFVAVAEAEGNEALPRLPVSCSDRIFHYLNNRDMRQLVKVCNPFKELMTEIYDMTIKSKIDSRSNRKDREYHVQTKYAHLVKKGRYNWIDLA